MEKTIAGETDSVFSGDSKSSRGPKLPRVSIGLPVYNGELFLANALESLVTQIFTDFEIIISDNSSTDATAEICREFAIKDPRIRYVRQPCNIGASANFDYVLKASVGEYFMWAAADDVRRPEFIDSLVTILDANICLVCAMTDVEVVDASGQRLRHENLDKIRLYKCLRHPIGSRIQFFKNPPSNLFFCIYGLYRRAFINNIEFNYESLVKYAGSCEIPILAQLASIGSIASVPGCFFVYMAHDSSAFNLEDRRRSLLSRLDGVVNICYVLLLIAAKAPVKTWIKSVMIAVAAITSLMRAGEIVVLYLLRATRTFSFVRGLFRIVRRYLWSSRC